MDYVEQLAKSVNPDIIVLDMVDKFASMGSERSDIYLKEAAIHARNIAKKYNWTSGLPKSVKQRMKKGESPIPE